jgi:hypothetical protein
MSCFILTYPQNGWDCVVDVYQAKDEDSAKSRIEKDYLPYSNDPEKAEKDRNEFWAEHILTERELKIVE